MARSLNGSVVAVVGSTGVLGAEIARVLIARGATVVRAGRQGDVDVVVDLQDPALVTPSWPTPATATAASTGW
jgi:NAD(P)-dependent dehydrogenase (short-subunit alcohol dehydrogenase family)